MTSSNATQRPRGRRRGPPKGAGTQRVYEHIRAKIMALDWPPGADVSEAEIVKDLGVSRTPVREALVRLSADGLIETPPNQGARVAAMDLRSSAEILEALELCQRAVNRWAAQKRTEADLAAIAAANAAFDAAADRADLDALVEANRAFHQAVGAACGNSVIAGVYDGLLGKTMRMARFIFRRRVETGAAEHGTAVVSAEHAQILDAVRARDAARADDLGGRHAASFRDAVAAFLSESAAADVTVADAAPVADDAPGARRGP
jgi:DNA-binding GntR family transcriptional regulator